jgi:Tn3 transposase DDE domain
VELNKGEARNALARAVCFRRLGRLRARAVEAQQYHASGLALDGLPAASVGGGPKPCFRDIFRNDGW